MGILIKRSEAINRKAMSGKLAGVGGVGAYKGREVVNNLVKELGSKSFVKREDLMAAAKKSGLSDFKARNIVKEFSKGNVSIAGKISDAKPKVDMNKVMQEIMAKRRTPNGNPAGQFPSASGRLSSSAPSAPPRLGQPGAAMTTSQFNQQFFKRGGSNLGLAGVAGTRH
ncbi:MAG TPA: hypothetical protein P5323_03545 [Candidatus Moranbacteria bacterium]|nr:hypothetical protein [Candidatus Moranbacteria bacterium]HSA08656.1 hypothetical protein [Candidatus Moranbacteria bacterium]